MPAAPRIARVCAALLPLANAHADEPAAQALRDARHAYTTAPIAERLTITVARGQGPADEAEVLLHLDLRPSARVNLDLTLGPIRAWAGPGIPEARIAITHAADLERYVGVGLWPLRWHTLREVLPALPAPQLALALNQPDEHTPPTPPDQIDLSPLLPPIRLDLVAQTTDSITLAGREAAASLTLTLDVSTSRIRTLEATIPAATGWYDITVTTEPLPEPAPDCAHSAAGALCPPNLTARRRVPTISDLRPRGLVLVPGADLAWVPLSPAPGHPALLGQWLEGDTPSLLILAQTGVDNSWMDAVGNLLTLAPDLPPSRCALLLFDLTGTPSRTRPGLEIALTERFGPDLRLAWVDARAIPLSQALPPMEVGAIVVSPDALIRLVMPREQAAEPDAADAIRRALTADPPPSPPAR